MCGISGIISKQKLKIDSNKIKQTNKILTGGPDAEGYYIKEILLLVIEENIIDLSKDGIQPMKIDGYVIIYNGEIYNYIEISDVLKDKRIMKTNSDTDLLQSYILGENAE